MLEKVDAVLRIMKKNDYKQSDISEIAECSPGEVSKILSGKRRAPWFWEKLLKETQNHELYIAMLEERLEAVNKLQEWIQKEKSPRKGLVTKRL